MVAPLSRLIRRRRKELRPEQLGPATIEALYQAIPEEYRNACSHLFGPDNDMYCKVRAVMTYNDSSNKRIVEEWFEQAILLAGHPTKSTGVEATQ